MGTLQLTDLRTSALDDLIRINKDRLHGYEKRIGESLDEDLEELFWGFIYQSRQNIADLTRYIHLLGGQPTGGICLSGKFYHAWMDLKSSVITQDRRTMLDYCENSEDVAMNAYRKALEDNELVFEDKKLTNLLSRQYHEFKTSLRQILALSK